ncbi:MAG: UMP kinase [Oscillospiraceae bacterium]|jgi:uridylate kinase|nr:UMP kinase [Oscillospiraceae bacterium]
MDEPLYKRVLIKISGEAIAGDGSEVLDFQVIGRICDVIKRCLDAGVQIGIVTGGGNIWRGAKDGADKMDRSRADHMGMLATAINGLALADALESRDVEVRVQTAIEMRAFAEPYTRLRAISHLARGRVVIFGCGTGNPFFSTDTAAVLRGAEIDADIVLLAKNVDGVYDDDPRKNPNAHKYEEMTPSDFLRDNLAAMDAAAASLSRDNNIPVLLFALSDPENIYRAVMGERVGTLVR